MPGPAPASEQDISPAWDEFLSTDLSADEEVEDSSASGDSPAPDPVGSAEAAPGPADTPPPAAGTEDAPAETPDETPEGQEPAAPPATAGQPADSPTPQAQPAAEPFTYKVDGKEFSVPNAVVFEDDVPGGGRHKVVVMPLSEFQNHIRPNLADRRAWQTKELDYRRQIAERDPESHPQVVKANALLAKLDELAFGENVGEDQILDAIEKFRAQRPTWEAQQEAAAARRQLEAVRGIQAEPDEEVLAQQAEELSGQLQTSLKGQLSELTKQPEFAGVSADEMFEDLWDVADRVFFEAPQDMPEFGLRKGDIGINLDFVEKRLGREAARVRQVREAAARADQAARKNAETLKRTDPPPTAGVRTGGSGGRQKEPVPASANWTEDFMETSLLDD